MPRLDHSVPVDGVLGKWGNPAVTLSEPHDIFSFCRRFPRSSGWQAPDDMRAKVYWGLDEKALCVAAEVTDDSIDRHKRTSCLTGRHAFRARSISRRLTGVGGL